MDIRESLILMRLRSFIEGAKRAGQQGSNGAQPDKWMEGYTNAMMDVLDHFDMLNGLSRKVDELMEKDK